MAAHADDLRYFYSEDLGSTVQANAATGTPTLIGPLEQGRYALRIVDFNGATDVWLRLGNEHIVAAAAAPATRFRGHTTVAELNKPVAFFMVRGGEGSKEYLSALGVGAAAVLQITKVSRGKN